MTDLDGLLVEIESITKAVARGLPAVSLFEKFKNGFCPVYKCCIHNPFSMRFENASKRLSSIFPSISFQWASSRAIAPGSNSMPAGRSCSDFRRRICTPGSRPSELRFPPFLPLMEYATLVACWRAVVSDCICRSGAIPRPRNHLRCNAELPQNPASA